MPQTPYAPFRPRAARLVAVVLLVVSLGGATLIVIRLAALGGDFARQIGPVIAVALLAAVLLWRILAVRAVPDGEGLRIHNLIRRRDVAWAQIVLVHLGERPWVQLDLSDGATVAVMAIQRADGEYSQVQASRLAALVAAHEGRSQDPGGTSSEE